MALLPLTRGLFAIVDKKDYKFLSQWKWTALKAGDNFYAVRGTGTDPNRKYWYMHREILGISGDRGSQVDHINRNGIDNRRRNLRIATPSQNRMNQRVRSDCALQMKGVSQLPGGRFRAKANNKHLGVFDTPQQAHKAYKNYARREFGEFARFS